MSQLFNENNRSGQALLAWWQSLQQHPGDRAEFRRARSASEVLLLPVYHHARRAFQAYIGEGPQNHPQLAAVLGLAAHVQVHRPASNDHQHPLAEQMARKQQNASRRPVSPLRFRRLLQHDREGLYVPMIRVIRQLDRQVNLHDLASSVYYWGDSVKRNWAFAYFPLVSDDATA